MAPTNDIRNLISNAFSQVNLILEGSEKFAERINEKDIAEGEKLLANLIRLGERSPLNMDYINDTKSAEEAGSRKANIFDYVIEKAIETYKTTNDPEIRNNIEGGLKVAYSPYSRRLKSTIINRIGGMGFNEFFPDAMVDAWEKKLNNNPAKTILQDYKGIGSFSSMIVNNFQNAVIDFFRKSSMKQGVSLDQPVGPGEKSTLGDIIGGEKGYEQGAGETPIDIDIHKRFRDTSYKALSWLEQHVSELMSTVFKEIVIFRNSPDDIIESGEYPFFQRKGDITDAFKTLINSVRIRRELEAIYKEDGLDINMRDWSSKIFYKQAVGEPFGGEDFKQRQSSREIDSDAAYASLEEKVMKRLGIVLTGKNINTQEFQL